MKRFLLWINWVLTFRSRHRKRREELKRELERWVDETYSGHEDEF